jgi:methyl-accepting chemotaxis protein
MTIKHKLILTSSLLTVLILAIGAILLFGYRYIYNHASRANAYDNEGKYLQMILRGVNEVIVTEGTPQSVAIVRQGIAGFETLHNDLLSEIHDDSLRESYIKNVGARWESIRNGVAPFLEENLDVESDDLMIRYGKVISETDELFNEVNRLSEQARVLIDSDSQKTKLIQSVIAVGLLLVLGVMLAILFKLYKSIISPIGELMRISEGFGNGDFSIVMKESGKDEFGKLASHFNQATAKLNDFISRLKKNVNTLNENTIELTNKARGIAANTLEQSSQTEHAATAMEELSSSFTNVAKSASDAAISAKEATELAANGGSVVTKTVEGMNRIARSVRESATSIEVLGKRSMQIGEIVKVINDIAEQTNLLALNAAIEAARAGEQGRGFAVVADEVRNLAEKTTVSTREIADMIRTIQNDANKAVESMHTGTKDVEDGVELANQAGESLQKIVDSVQNVTDMIHQIAATVEEQSSTGGEVASNIESVAAITRKTADSAGESFSYSNELKKMSADLQALAEEFKLRTDQSATLHRETATQSVTAQHI